MQDYFARYDIPNDIRKRAITQLLTRHTNRRLMRDDFLLKDMAPSMRVRGAGWLRGICISVTAAAQLQTVSGEQNVHALMGGWVISRAVEEGTCLPAPSAVWEEVPPA